MSGQSEGETKNKMGYIQGSHHPFFMVFVGRFGGYPGENKNPGRTNAREGPRKIQNTNRRVKIRQLRVYQEWKISML